MKAEWRTIARGTARNPASRNGLAPALDFEGTLSHHMPARSARDRVHVVEAERQQHRLLQPLIDLPLAISPRSATRVWPLSSSSSV